MALRMTPDERDAILAAIAAQPPVAYRWIGERFDRHVKTIAALARAHGVQRQGK